MDGMTANVVSVAANVVRRTHATGRVPRGLVVLCLCTAASTRSFAALALFLPQPLQRFLGQAADDVIYTAHNPCQRTCRRETTTTACAGGHGTYVGEQSESLWRTGRSDSGVDAGDLSSY